MASAIVSYAPWLAWAFVPPLATKYTLDFLYSARLVARPASPSIAQAHATRTRILLIAAYLIYQFTTSLSSSSTEPTAYRLLEVGVESDIETIKRSFRRLAKIHHPDKVGPSGERFFIALRRSHDVLTDSVRRFAYDRFGIAVLDWRGALTVREYMVIGLRESLLFWLVNSAIFAVLSWLNGAGAGKAASPWSYWHLTLLFSLSSLELYLITTPTRPRLVRRFLPRHTSGDVVAVLRQTYTSTIMAMRQILPLLGEAGATSEIRTLAEANKFIEALAGEMDKLGVGAMTMRRQSDLAVAAELQPFRASSSQHDAAVPVAPPSNGALRQRSPLELSYVNHVTQSLINRSLQASPEVQRAIAERRRMQAAAEDEATTVPPAPAAEASSSSSPTAAAAAAQPALPPRVAYEAGGEVSPPASPRSVASGKSLQPRVSERRSSLGSSSQSHRRRSGGGGGGSRDIRDLPAELRGEQGQGQGVLGLDVQANGGKEGAMEHSAAGPGGGVDHSREVPPYPQSPKLGGGYTMIS